MIGAVSNQSLPVNSSFQPSIQGEKAQKYQQTQDSDSSQQVAAKNPALESKEIKAASSDRSYDSGASTSGSSSRGGNLDISV